MTGSKRQLRQGVWELRVSLGRDRASGKYKQLSRTYRGDAAGADEALRALVEVELPKLRMTTAPEERGSFEERDRRRTLDEHGPAPAPFDGREDPHALRLLLAALPLEPGECVVGWTADRGSSAPDELEAEYGRGDATSQLVLLHRLRQREGGLSSATGDDVRTVWVPREIVERARPSFAHDCAIHVWTL